MHVENCAPVRTAVHTPALPLPVPPSPPPPGSPQVCPEQTQVASAAPAARTSVTDAREGRKHLLGQRPGSRGGGASLRVRTAPGAAPGDRVPAGGKDFSRTPVPRADGQRKAARKPCGAGAPPSLPPARPWFSPRPHRLRVGALPPPSRAPLPQEQVGTRAPDPGEPAWGAGAGAVPGPGSEPPGASAWEPPAVPTASSRRTDTALGTERCARGQRLQRDRRRAGHGV